MNIPKEDVLTIVIDAIKETNLTLTEGKKLRETPDAVIFGEEGGLDSIDFVCLVTLLEDKISEKFDKAITITSDKAFSLKYNPFANVSRMTDFLMELLSE